MKALLVSALAISALAGCASLSTEPSAAAPPREVRMAFDITDAATQPLLVKLENIDTTRKQLLDAGFTPRIVLGFRGNASYFTQTDLSLVKEADRADALKIQEMLRRLRKSDGVESVEQCNLPLASRKIQAQNLMQEVKLVPNGWISLAEHQRRGYAYIAP